MKKNNLFIKTSIFIYLVFSNHLLIASNNENAPIIQPGAPGYPSKVLNESEATNIANTSYINADVKFLQGMIVHHEQAILMSEMADIRTNNKTVILDLAKRIDASQKDEINFMESWLKEEMNFKILKIVAMEINVNIIMHASMNMEGMATPKQLDDLRNSKSTDFDRLFLQLMINHHDGALEMVEELKKYPGNAYDPILNEFVSDLINDQGVEIERMNVLLVGLSDDPRSGLAAGLFIAEEAILNMELITSLKKPTGFFDPENPAEKGSEDLTEDNENKTTAEISRSLRSPMLSFANTDMAFKDNILVAGSYHGFNIYELNENGIPNLVSSVVCPGGQGDVSIVENLLIMSVEENRSRIDCGLEGVNRDSSPDRFRGIRIFDISNLYKPRQVGAVQTCRGSHTHSVVSSSKKEGKIIVYNSGTGRVRDNEENLIVLVGMEVAPPISQ
jgi:uncharacterized protein (DUF305 family)